MMPWGLGFVGWACQMNNRSPHYQAITLTPTPFLHLGCLGTLVPIVRKGTLRGRGLG